MGQIVKNHIHTRAQKRSFNQNYTLERINKSLVPKQMPVPQMNCSDLNISFKFKYFIKSPYAQHPYKHTHAVNLWLMQSDIHDEELAWQTRLWTLHRPLQSMFLFQHFVLLPCIFIGKNVLKFFINSLTLLMLVTEYSGLFGQYYAF